MDPIRYKPGEAIRWLETGAEQSRKTAKSKGKELLDQTGAPGVKRIGSGVGALIDLGKGAWADVLHKQAEASEYVLQNDLFDVVAGKSIKSVRYSDVRKISAKGEKVTITLDRGTTLTLKPYAHITAGRIRVPVGWLRNGMEVPYELLIEELAARCKVEVETS